MASNTSDQFFEPSTDTNANFANSKIFNQNSYMETLARLLQIIRRPERSTIHQGPLITVPVLTNDITRNYHVHN